MIMNNYPLTYIYPTNLEGCLTPNHLLIGLTLNYVFDHNTSITYQSIGLSECSNSVNDIINYFGDRWRTEYVVNLRQTCKLMKSI